MGSGGAQSSLSISLSKWNLLSQNEKNLAKKLGITIQKGENGKGVREPANKVTVLKEYYLGFHVTCQLCGAMEDKVFLMRLEKKGQMPVLISTQPFDEVDKVKWEDRESPACRNCDYNLLQTPKRDLIAQLKSSVTKIAVLMGRKFRVRI